MKVFLYKLGKPAFPHSREWVETYIKRMRGQISVASIEAREKPKDPLGFLRFPPSSEHRLVALDERGKEWSSQMLATKLDDWFANPQIKSLSFVVGGPYGIPKDLIDAAHDLWSLSKGTFPSDIAWLVTAEQLYRACSIRQGTGYHHGDVLT